jgi:hypothetical protein
MDEVELTEAALLRVHRARQQTLASINVKLAEVERLRTVYANQGKQLDTLLERRMEAEVAQVLGAGVAPPPPPLPTCQCPPEARGVVGSPHHWAWCPMHTPTP